MGTGRSCQFPRCGLPSLPPLLVSSVLPRPLPQKQVAAASDFVIMWGEREGEEQYMQDHHLMVKGGGSETNVMNGDAMVGGGGVGLGGYPGLQAVSAAELESQHRLLQTDHLLHPHDYRHDQVS